MLSEHLPTRVIRIGLPDAYAESGPHEALLDLYNLSVDAIVSRIEAAVHAKS
ncbi:MAG: hypothetical protein LIP77_04755 [Planctomycetes bacterium]|nr:hypothetical protein [Planctomycetota bacterium]